MERQYKVALIDEFQDTDPLQCEIFTALFGGRTLVFIGDPKQAIYAFRGADVFAYLQARRGVAETARWSLATNHRSEESMVGATNALFRARTGAFVYDEIPFEEVEAAEKPRARIGGDDDAALTWLLLPGRIGKGAAEAAACRATVTGIVKLLTGSARIDDRPVAAADIAVLVRTNTQGRMIRAALMEAGVAAVLSRSGDIFHSEEATELQAILSAVLDPTDGRALRAALATRALGLDARALTELAADDDRWQALVAEVSDLRRRWQRRGLLAMLGTLERRFDLRSHLLEADDGARRMTNWRHIVELTHRFATERSAGPAAVADWLATERARKNHEAEAAELRLESDAEAVRIVTVHKSKGLEYGIVFVPFAWSDRLFSDDGPHRLHLDADRIVYACGPAATSRAPLARAEELAEKLRLAYVALTRSVHRCYVVWGDIGSSHGDYSGTSSLGWLLRGVGAATGEPPGDASQDSPFAITAARVRDGELDAVRSPACGEGDGAFVRELRRVR